MTGAHILCKLVPFQSLYSIADITTSYKQSSLKSLVFRDVTILQSLQYFRLYPNRKLYPNREKKQSKLK